jgi:hypothetical protein
MSTKKITYYADDNRMGDTDAEDCDEFRHWAHEQLAARYPAFEIEVSDAAHIEETVVCGYDNLSEVDEIRKFAGYLLDDFPWDWIDD